MGGGDSFKAGRKAGVDAHQHGREPLQEGGEGPLCILCPGWQGGGGVKGCIPADSGL